MSEEKARKKGRTPLPSLSPERLARVHNNNRARAAGYKTTGKTTDEITDENTDETSHSSQQSQPKATKRRHHPLIPCDICGKLLKGPRIVKCHKLTVHIGTRCYWGKCAETFATTELLIEHLKDHQARESTDDNPGELICHWPGCGHPHSDIRELYRHIRIHNGDVHQSNN
ncbi:hypothetical protein F5Y00DRAFT_258699 [Daldinia vernicosa]|uniref:uncharacterized protein n=1 Tax=Daldinia vernicosa TaxID=114800 RepID=UPI0020088AAC|nr:uncharacterized protein F5Y00DRAFT_258699 [Daldinia vernicosa]KAI0852292.1 hypothetical protein F5Y00DRAFT_258699 [Daldinia vernicosa]